ncbi:type I restriction enzyme M protein [Tamilnaduibacter salinus]|uniref:site-specific DNA-methyltransferase (adenine-specific) n=1 Tax=Tamilnaduibacter salinus TaxID=1484056 RepID=A0A2A2I6A7_9GAMM|nr:class I SAM-dependent DNA methyltransferase [Tamilnaduibacter salinus]PAV27541.1 restriction endonuclease subunit M [Tamilnaduibacter salinus]PVY77015.1 type I restriction enzyme M protein [Tamilnaduibacter salinus]
MNTENHSELASFIWSIADLLRGDMKQSQYGRVILPFTLLRRMECVLAPTKEAVLAAAEQHENKPETARDRLLRRASGQDFYNASKLTLSQLSDTQTGEDLLSYVHSFSEEAREIFEHFNFEDFVQLLEGSDLLYQVVQAFSAVDLSPQRISNYGMGAIFEELIRKFAESSNETAGEHFTPRDIVHLATSLVLTGEEDRLQPGRILTIYDPTAGTGGFLSEGEAYVNAISNDVQVSLSGQELNPESYAICVGDMLIKGQPVRNIRRGNTLSDDQLRGEHFDIMLSNPPFGVDWKKVREQVEKEHKQQGYNGRFGPGLPRVSDGSLLFLMHLVAKMRAREDGGSRIGIILNGSPLFTGGAGSGESEIRRYLLEHDLVEAIVALPSDAFFNTGINTYVWVLSNQKPDVRKGKVQLINATDRYAKMRKSLGSKRHYIPESEQDAIVRQYGRFEETDESKIFPTQAFGYRRITVERPLQLNFQASEERLARLQEEKFFGKLSEDEQNALLAACDTLGDTIYRNREDFLAALKNACTDAQFYPSAAQLKNIWKALGEHDDEADYCRDKKGRIEPNPDLRDNENVPLGESVYDYFEREVLPHVPDAWIDESKTDDKDGEVGIVGYEIPFNRHFYVFEPPRPLEEIDADLKQCTDRIKQMIEELSA